MVPKESRSVKRYVTAPLKPHEISDKLSYKDLDIIIPIYRACILRQFLQTRKSLRDIWNYFF